MKLTFNLPGRLSYNIKEYLFPYITVLRAKWYLTILMTPYFIANKQKVIIIIIII